jgi:hypothetical protein
MGRTHERLAQPTNRLTAAGHGGAVSRARPRAANVSRPRRCDVNGTDWPLINMNLTLIW